MRLRKFIISIFMILSLLTAAPLGIAQTSTPQWENAEAITGNFKAVASNPEFEVFSAPNVIMLKVNKEIDVRVFTILGKLISAQHLQPGIFQCNLDSHGIYIIKTDKASCKLAI